jgi:hypothetical protein
MELDKEEIRIMLIALDWYYDYLEEEDIDELTLAKVLKGKLRYAFDSL